MTDILRERIITGEYKPGERLLYKNLSDDLGVSLSPIREALINLEKQGVITIVPRKGAIVRLFSESETLEYAYIRYHMELIAVEKICERGLSREEVAELRKLNVLFAGAITNHCQPEILQYDNEFHSELIRLSGMKILQEIMCNLPLVMYLARSREKYLALFSEKAIDVHDQIIDALAASDYATAKDALYVNVYEPTRRMILGC